MTVGLRERKQRAAMRGIQKAALDLFDERGYAAVSVEEIAERAEVSPSSVYRYFGSKGAILVVDEHDRWLRRDLAEVLREVDLNQAWDRFVLAYAAQTGAWELDEENGDWLLRRLRYCFGEPDVRLALFEMLDDQAGIVSGGLTATGTVTPTQAHVLGHAFIFGFWAVVEQWHADGAVRPLVDYVAEGLGILSIRLPSAPEPLAGRTGSRSAVAAAGPAAGVRPG